jgi:photosystem II stability/assembly factor-like uncharacterized protein
MWAGTLIRPSATFSRSTREKDLGWLLPEEPRNPRNRTGPLSWRMRLRDRVLAVVVFATLFAAAASAQPDPRWLLFGPPAGSIEQFAFDPQDSAIVYAATSNGIYRSQDGGLRWALARITASRFISSLAVAPSDSHVVYATCPFGLFRSTDRGVSWTLLTGASWYHVAVSPTDANLVYGHTSFGFVRSADGGVTRTIGGVGLPEGPTMTDLLVDPNAPGTLYVAFGSNDGVYKSIDGGATWSRASFGLGHFAYFALAAPPSRPGTLYLAAGQVLYKSTNSAATWVPHATQSGYIVDVDAVDDIITIATTFGVQTSLNAGTTWSPAILGASAAVARDPRTAQTVLVENNQSIRRSVDGGATFELAGHGMGAGAPAFLTASPHDPRSVLTGGAFGLYRTNDGGVTWSRLGLAAFTADAAFFDAVRPEVLYVLTGNDVIQRSTDGGQTFATISGGLPGGSALLLAVDPKTSGVLYATSGTTIYRKQDDSDWTLRSGGLPQNFAASVITVDPGAPSTLYAIRTTQLFRSTNSGGSWSPMTPPPTSGMKALAVDPKDSQHLLLSTNTFPWESTNGGQSWTELTSAPSGSTMHFDPVHAGVVYGASAAALMRRNAGSTTWVTPLPTTQVPFTLFAISADGRSFYTGSSLGGVWTWHSLRRRSVR